MNSLKDVAVSFDDESKVRVLDQDTYSKCDTLSRECSSFVNKMQDFSGTVETLLEILEAQAKVIEREKLKAIGMRNLVEGETENRKRQVRQTHALLAERQCGLDRLNKQFESLQKVEAEQRAILDKLNNNEA